LKFLVAIWPFDASKKKFGYKVYFLAQVVGCFSKIVIWHLHGCLS
jgi:hypothetical protein